MRLCIYSYTVGIHEQSSSSSLDHPESRQRLWNDTRTQHISRLRRESSPSSSSNQSTTTSTSTNNLRRLNNVILDLTRTTHIDTTGLQALDDMRAQILDWAGPHVSISIVGANKRVQDRIQRHRLSSKNNADKNAEGRPLEAGYQVFELLQDALASKGDGREEGLVIGEEDIKGV